ncbi:DNA ligase 1-like [Anthonomus grandis grandis]|uniref:DNA ligase 1-like n=1 Tax=Anthonomus grandis grandis TaxID=2921223 RepID=UPI0021663B5D|nr:DNA ligase 1-like [Anthonomus grandis grandis]
MTRFARAKGSKASNERLPEPATSWSQMKAELLNKNNELAEKKEREKALKQRQENYQKFLDQKEQEEEKQISWADFPTSDNHLESKKRKRFSDLNKSDSEIKKKINKNQNCANIKIETPDLMGLDSDGDSDGQFSALKLKLDKVLDQKGNDSDDEPPEEASITEKPEEIVVKKPKLTKKKLKIVVDKEQQISNEANTSPIITNGVQSDKSNKSSIKPEHKIELSEKSKKLIEKKLERKRKQNETKILKKQKKNNTDNTLKKANTPNEENQTVTPKPSISGTSDEEFLKKKQKKLERRKKQKEKKSKMMKQASKESVEDKKEVLSEKDLLKIQRKKERRARQADKRKKIKEAKLLAEQNTELSQENKDETKPTFKKVKDSAEQNEYIKEENEQKHKIPFDNGKASAEEKKNVLHNGEHEPQNGYTKPPLNKQKKLLQKPQNQKKAKPRDDKEHQSKKDKPEKMIINGKEIEIGYVEGFPVKKEDADRLKRLRKEMISKGLPRSEINASLKLERRRAEKALAREKKFVCFNCRKSGHNLSECPELDKDQVAQTGTGICFKCGSTEHTHFECKVVRGLDYKFATCFICQEQGHIAKQCPDNQRGLYPKGGSCKVCGDVTHLKKDCPKYQAQQAQLQNSLNVGTMDSGNPDDLDSNSHSNSFGGSGRKINKIIKF